jgi:hypothetical protein
LSIFSTSEEVKDWFSKSNFSDLYDPHFREFNGEVLFALPIHVFVNAFGIVKGSGLYYMLNPNVDETESEMVLRRKEVAGLNII